MAYVSVLINLLILDFESSYFGPIGDGPRV
jgi:hypothetical protein